MLCCGHTKGGCCWAGCTGPWPRSESSFRDHNNRPRTDHAELLYLPRRYSGRQRIPRPGSAPPNPAARTQAKISHTLGPAEGQLNEPNGLTLVENDLAAFHHVLDSNRDVCHRRGHIAAAAAAVAARGLLVLLLLLPLLRRRMLRRLRRRLRIPLLLLPLLLLLRYVPLGVLLWRRRRCRLRRRPPLGRLLRHLCHRSLLPIQRQGHNQTAVPLLLVQPPPRNGQHQLRRRASQRQCRADDLGLLLPLGARPARQPGCTARG